MSIEKITSKIIEDAELEAKKISDDAKAKADESVQQAEAKAAEIVKNAEVEAIAEKAKIISRRKSVSDIDERKMLLTEKQNLMDACFNEAIKNVSSMEKDKYIEFLAGLVKNTGLKSGEIVLNHKDARAVGQELLAKLGTGFTLSGETRDFAGGLMIKEGQIYTNATIESFAKDARETMALEVAEVLFQ